MSRTRPHTASGRGPLRPLPPSFLPANLHLVLTWSPRDSPLCVRFITSSFYPCCGVIIIFTGCKIFRLYEGRSGCSARCGAASRGTGTYTPEGNTNFASNVLESGDQLRDSLWITFGYICDCPRVQGPEPALSYHVVFHCI